MTPMLIMPIQFNAGLSVYNSYTCICVTENKQTYSHWFDNRAYKLLLLETIESNIHLQFN